MDFPIEMHATMTYQEKCEALESAINILPDDFHNYRLLGLKKCPQGSGLTFLAIQDYLTSKVNVYGTVDEFIIYNIVKYYKPISITAAKVIFPEMNFNEDNYGFVRYESANAMMH